MAPKDRGGRLKALITQIRKGKSPGRSAPVSQSSSITRLIPDNGTVKETAQEAPVADVSLPVAAVDVNPSRQPKNEMTLMAPLHGIAIDVENNSREHVSSGMVSSLTDAATLSRHTRNPSLQVEQPSDGDRQLETNITRQTSNPAYLGPGSPRPRGSSVNSTRSSITKKPPSQIIEEPHLTDMLPEPSDVSYTLEIAYNNQPIGKEKVLSFAWQDSAFYDDLDAKIVEHQRARQRKAEPGHTVRIYYSSFRIVGQDHEYSEKISAMTELKNITIRNICGFIYAHPQQRFHLEYYINFSSVRTEKYSPKERYVEMVGREVQRLMSINSNYSNQKFVPKIDRDQFKSEEIIRGILSENSSLDLPSASDLATLIIKGGARGIFLACVTSYQRDPIDVFKQLFPAYTDDALPPMLPNPTSLSLEDYHSLVMHIHAFFAETIDGGGRHMELKDHEIMPILHVRDETANTRSTVLGAGAAGMVWKVRVESGHHTLPGHHKSLFALKTINQQNKHLFDREQAMLSRLRKQRHPHIVRHIMSWCQQGTYHILYPLATGNLRTYMRDTPSPDLCWPSVRWFLRQICGLVSAIYHVHDQQELDEKLDRYTSSTPPSSIDPRTRKRLSADSITKPTSKRSGYHHDLKPENILIFERQEGINPVFKIHDFGAGKFTDYKEEEESKASHIASNLGGTASYFGPEWDQDKTRPFDIWAMACILTELVIWFFQGVKLEEFHNERVKRSVSNPAFAYDYYWQEEGQSRRLKPSVIKYLNGIDDFIKRDHNSLKSLDTVLKDLPATIRSCFAIEPSKRPNAKKLYEDLQRMNDRADIAGEETEISIHTPSTGSRHSQDDGATRFHNEVTAPST